MKVDINTQNRLKTARIKMSKICPSHKANKTWPMVRLGDVCDEIKNRIQSSKVAVGEYVTTDNMVKDRGGIVQAEYVPSDVGLVEYRKGDVLIANIRPYLKKIWLADHDGGCSSDVVVFRTNTDGLSSEYLYSVLSQDAYFEYVMQKPRGTKMPRGDRDWMKEFCFPLPPLSEQKEIVVRLERELAAVEKMKKGFEALAETAKAEFKAELKEVFEELRCSGVESKRLGEVGRVAMCKRVLKAQTSDNGDIPFFKIGTFGKEPNAYISNELFSEFVKKFSYPKKGDVLISAAGTIGRTIVFDGRPSYFQDSNIVWLEHDGTKVTNEYLHCFYWSKPWKVSDGATIPRIYNGDIESAEIPLPSLPVQRQTVDRLSAAKARAEKLEAKAREGVAVCETMRKAILKEAFA